MPSRPTSPTSACVPARSVDRRLNNHPWQTLHNFRPQDAEYRITEALIIPLKPHRGT